MKRDSGSSVSLVILRQFLLLLPLDCTFADLTTRVTHQYEKLYQTQPAYVPIKKIVLFRDSNQCDLDLDYLVSDICASNDLIYAMVEIDESSKKIKITSENINADPSIKQQQHSDLVKAKQNEKKVPEFKPTPVKAPTAKQVPVKNITESKPIEATKSTDIKPVEVSKPVEVKVPVTKMSEKKTPETKVMEKKVVEVKVVEKRAAVPKTSESKVTESKPVDAKVSEPKAVEPKVSEVKKADIKAPELELIETKDPEPKTADHKASEVKVTDHKASEVKVTDTKAADTPVKAATPIAKPTAKKNQKPVEETVKTDQTCDSKVSTEIFKSSEPEINLSIAQTSVAPSQQSEFVAPVINSYADAVNVTSSEITNGESKRSSDMITPVPTPISRPIFHPRKSEIPAVSSSSSDEEDDGSILKTFDATNLFGPQVITSEPRRSDAFVLFAARSSDDSNASSDENESTVVNIPAVPLKSSSIVSLQAAPSSDLCEEESESESEKENDAPELPHSVTMRRLSSVSPIPDPSEIPSLSELKESINRAPTPIQIVQQQQQQQQQQKNNLKTAKGGRPAKKQNTGRPKKVQ